MVLLPDYTIKKRKCILLKCKNSKNILNIKLCTGWREIKEATYRLKCIAETKLNWKAQRAKIKRKRQIKGNTYLKFKPLGSIKKPSKKQLSETGKIIIHIMYREHLQGRVTSKQHKLKIRVIWSW